MSTLLVFLLLVLVLGAAFITYLVFFKDPKVGYLSDMEKEYQDMTKEIDH